MKAVILAGGLGIRLKPFTKIIPKPLLPIGESSVLEIQILALQKHGFDEVYIATNYKSEFVQAYIGDGEKYGLKVVFSREDRPLGTCGPLTLLKEMLTEPFLLMNGDILTTLNFTDLIKFSNSSEAELTVVTKEITTPFHFGKVVARDNYIVEIEEKPNFKLEIIAGIYHLRPSVLSMIPENREYGIDHLIKDMLSAGKKVAKFLTRDYWLDIGSLESYEMAQSAYQQYFSGVKMPPESSEERKVA